MPRAADSAETHTNWLSLVALGHSTLHLLGDYRIRSGSDRR